VSVLRNKLSNFLPALDSAVSQLTKKQTKNINRRFELGVYRKKAIADYPVLLRYLVNAIGGAHDRFLHGDPAKLTLGHQWILDSPRIDAPVDDDFWVNKIGCYRVENSVAYKDFVHLHVDLRERKDIFYPDDYILLTPQATCQISVCSKGRLEYIDIILNTKPPQFIRELARQFPMNGPYARRKLRKEIRLLGEEPDETFLAPFSFGSAIAIYLDDTSEALDES
jgi:hypothetical protein